MLRECVDCGKKFDRTKNERLCPECSFLNKHRRCTECGKIFYSDENEQEVVRKKCFDCQPAEGPKKINAIDRESAFAKRAGMTYGKYQQWKYQQQFRTNKMIRKINREING